MARGFLFIKDCLSFITFLLFIIKDCLSFITFSLSIIMICLFFIMICLFFIMICLFFITFLLSFIMGGRVFYKSVPSSYKSVPSFYKVQRLKRNIFKKFNKITAFLAVNCNAYNSKAYITKFHFKTIRKLYTLSMYKSANFICNRIVEGNGLRLQIVLSKVGGNNSNSYLPKALFIIHLRRKQ